MFEPRATDGTTIASCAKPNLTNPENPNNSTSPRQTKLNKAISKLNPSMSTQDHIKTRKMNFPPSVFVLYPPIMHGNHIFSCFVKYVVCVCVSVCVCTRLSVCLCVYVFLPLCVSVFMYACVCMCMRVFECVCVCLSVCMYFLCEVCSCE